MGSSRPRPQPLRGPEHRVVAAEVADQLTTAHRAVSQAHRVALSQLGVRDETTIEVAEALTAVSRAAARLRERLSQR